MAVVKIQKELWESLGIDQQREAIKICRKEGYLGPDDEIRGGTGLSFPPLNLKRPKADHSKSDPDLLEECYEGCDRIATTVYQTCMVSGQLPAACSIAAEAAFDACCFACGK